MVAAWFDEHPWNHHRKEKAMGNFVQMIQQMLPADWEVYDPQMGSSCLLQCPHGNVVEQDGICPEGCVSPLITLGIL